MLILDIINNLALLALISIVSGFLRKRCPGVKRQAVAQGLLFGCACIIGMLHPVVVASGVFYDGRSIMLGLCGLFFGPIAVAVAGAMALAVRLAQGGPGALPGALVIVSASLLGVAFHLRRDPLRPEPSVTQLSLFGLLVHGVMVLTMFALPLETALHVIRTMAVPVLVVYPLVTVLIGSILSDQMSRDRFLEQLRESEERLRTTLYSIGDGVITTDASGVICHLNPVAEKLTGWKEAEARGRPCSEVFHIINEGTRVAETSPIDHVLRDGVIVGLANHTLLVTRDGFERPIADSGAPIRASDGTLTGVVLVFRDQTEERAAQQNLVRNEERIRRLVENAPIGIFTSTATGRILMLNDAMARTLGYPSAGDIPAGTDENEKPFYVCPESRDDFFSRLASEGSVKGCELELMTFDRRRIWVSMTARMIDPAADGNPLVEGFCTEITERKKTELELVRNANRMNVLLRILLYPAKNAQAILDYALEEVLKLTGSKIGYIYHYSEERKQFVLNTWSKEVMKQCSVVEPQTCYELDKTGLWGEAVRQRRAIVTNNFAAENPLKKGIPAGHVKLERFLTVPVFQDDKIVGVVGVANKDTDYDQEDVIQLQVLLGSVWKEIDRLHMKESQEKLEEQLHQSQKMESVGRLAGGVAHDFNNILQAMLGYSELLLETLPEEDRARDLVREIVSEGKRAATLTNQLLAFARKQPINPKVLDINETVGSMLKLLRRLLGEDINLVWHPGEGLWPVQMDPGQLDQILANLTVNARDAIAGIGRMTIETCRAVLDEAYCAEHLGATPGKYVMLAVSDDGCGMSKETMSRLFEPFFTTKMKGKGTGLGLATIYGIVKQNRGNISVYSEPQKGTTFKIYLPAFTEGQVEAEEVLESVPAAAPAPGEKKTVLVVDDEDSLLYSGRMLLESLGYQVLTARGSAEALILSETYPDEIHVLLTDVVMPLMSGRELQQRLSAQRPGMKCVFMSGYTSDVIAHHGVLDAGVLFLQKPFTKAALGAKIGQALAGG
jgi:PAS domain S-box-containing protein